MLWILSSQLSTFHLSMYIYIKKQKPSSGIYSIVVFLQLGMPKLYCSIVYYVDWYEQIYPQIFSSIISVCSCAQYTLSIQSVLTSTFCLNSTCQRKRNLVYRGSRSKQGKVAFAKQAHVSQEWPNELEVFQFLWALGQWEQWKNRGSWNRAVAASKGQWGMK